MEKRLEFEAPCKRLIMYVRVLQSAECSSMLWTQELKDSSGSDVGFRDKHRDEFCSNPSKNIFTKSFFLKLH